MACHGGLTTKDKMNRFGFVDNDMCVLCRQQESLQHMLFTCEGVQGIWIHVLKWNQIYHRTSGSNDELLWSIEQSKGNSAEKKPFSSALLRRRYTKFGNIEMLVILMGIVSMNMLVLGLLTILSIDVGLNLG